MKDVKELLIDKNCKVIWKPSNGFPFIGELRLRHPKTTSYQLITKATLTKAMGDFIAEAIEEKIKREQEL